MPKDHPIRTPPFYARKTSNRMLSPRRIKVLFVLVLVIVVTILLYTASLRQSRTPDNRTFGDFYSNTVNGLDKKAGSVSGDEEIAKQMSQRLKEAAQKAKDNANAKAPKPDPPSEVIGKGNAADRNVAGRKKYETKEAQDPIKDEAKEAEDIAQELRTILKKSPIIIFSKSYCPHSKDAKRTFAKYSIDPPPYIVELDQHPMGAGLQSRLAGLTGRRTVPNVLVNEISIGGGDDVLLFDLENKLIDKVKEFAGKKIVDIKKKPDAEDGHGLR